MLEQIHQSCAICDEVINIEFPSTTQLPCQHNNMFHNECIIRWIENKHRPGCPYCRREITLTEEQLQIQIETWGNPETRYVRPVYDEDTQRRIEEARTIEINRIQHSIEERIRQIRARR